MINFNWIYFCKKHLMIIFSSLKFYWFKMIISFTMFRSLNFINQFQFISCLYKLNQEWGMGGRVSIINKTCFTIRVQLWQVSPLYTKGLEVIYDSKRNLWLAKWFNLRIGIFPYVIRNWTKRQVINWKYC